MAKPEQTEKPTPKRRGEARKKAQVPRSPDVAGSFVFLGVVITIHVMFRAWVNSIGHLMRVSLTHLASDQPVTIYTAWADFAVAFGMVLPLLGGVFLVAVIAAYVSNVMQFGFLFT